MAPCLPPDRRVPVLHVHVDPLDLGTLMDLSETFVAGDQPRQIITANALMILASEDHPDLGRAFGEAALVIPDSAGVSLAARIRGRPLPQKIPGIDLTDHLCRRAAEKGWRVFFLGAAPGVAEAAARNLAGRHPGLRVAGVRDGYFSEREEPAVVETISRAAPDLLFVAMDTPRQDVWIHRRLDRLNCKVAMGVGGTFDVLSGRLRRAPAWMREAGLEWLFRLIQEPRRLWRMRRLPLFLWKVLSS